MLVCPARMMVRHQGMPTKMRPSIGLASGSSSRDSAAQCTSRRTRTPRLLAEGKDGQMSQQYKPEGYPGVAVYIMADGAQRVITFLKETFDAEVLRRADNPDGTIMHAEVRVDDTVVMLA